jgi:hypothetical protein
MSEFPRIITRTPNVEFFCGLDLGQAADPSALAILQYTWLATSQPSAALQFTQGARPAPAQSKAPEVGLMHLQRWPLKTSYLRIVEDLAAMINRPKRSAPHIRPLVGCHLIVDATGVGRPVVENIRAAKLPCKLRPVIVTGGHKASLDEGYWHVPKVELGAVVHTLLAGRRLLQDPDLPMGDILARELSTFTVKPTAAGNLTVESWREKEHDDLVFAVAFAAWAGERHTPGQGFAPYVAPCYLRS